MFPILFETIQRESSISFPLLGGWSVNPPASFSVFGRDIYFYGVLIALGFILAILYCARRAPEFGISSDSFYDLSIWVIPLSILGARLYFVAFQADYYLQHPGEILAVWEGGLAIYGGVIGGAVGALLFSRKKKVSFSALADMVAPALILGQAIGRWGNFVNQEAYGAVIDNPALQFFPLAVFADGEWHMAAFFYESLWDFIGFWLLWLNRKRAKVRGNLFLCYLVWYGLGRAVIEGLRTDSLMWGSVRVSQALSGALVLAAGIALILRRRKHRGEKPYPVAEE